MVNGFESYLTKKSKQQKAKEKALKRIEKSKQKEFKIVTKKRKKIKIKSKIKSAEKKLKRGLKKPVTSGYINLRAFQGSGLR
jgi:hypothetical protein